MRKSPERRIAKRFKKVMSGRWSQTKKTKKWNKKEVKKDDRRKGRREKDEETEEEEEQIRGQWYIALPNLPTNSNEEA